MDYKQLFLTAKEKGYSAEAVDYLITLMDDPIFDEGFKTKLLLSELALLEEWLLQEYGFVMSFTYYSKSLRAKMGNVIKNNYQTMLTREFVDGTNKIIQINNGSDDRIEARVIAFTEALKII